MMNFVGRDGEPCEDVLDWARRYEDVAYRVVAVDADEHRMVSTIWEGYDTRALLENAMPLIYETALMEDGRIVDSERWPDEAAALVGHAIGCRTWLGRYPRPEEGLVQLIIEREKKDGHRG